MVGIVDGRTAEPVEPGGPGSERARPTAGACTAGDGICGDTAGRDGDVDGSAACAGDNAGTRAVVDGATADGTFADEDSAEDSGAAAAAREPALAGVALGSGTALDEPLGETTPGEAPLGTGLLGPAVCDADEPGSPGSDVTAVPRAAGIDDEGRRTGDAAVRGAAGFGGADGDSTAINTVRPMKPIMTAAMPYRRSVLSDMPRPDGGE